MIDLLRPDSVVDVGCGVGSWLAEFQAAGIDDVLGVDGPHLDLSFLRISREKLVIADLCDDLPLTRRFDLALCHEVAGYIPGNRAPLLVETLTRLAPVVAFSAAIPLQDGIQVNQQWPEYWAALFADKEFVCVDCLREKFWYEDEVAWWFRQNLYLMVHKDHLAKHVRLRELHARSAKQPLRLVHPDHYLELHSRLRENKLLQAARDVKKMLRKLVD